MVGLIQVGDDASNTAAVEGAKLPPLAKKRMSGFLSQTVAAK
jgi:hypothetical protein